MIEWSYNDLGIHIFFLFINFNSGFFTVYVVVHLISQRDWFSLLFCYETVRNSSPKCVATFFFSRIHEFIWRFYEILSSLESHETLYTNWRTEFYYRTQTIQSRRSHSHRKNPVTKTKRTANMCADDSVLQFRLLQYY